MSNPARLWKDAAGAVHPVIDPNTPLDFVKNREHAALRAFVFTRDNFTCRRCGRRPAENECQNYDGTTCPWIAGRGHLNVDHILSRRAGGSNHPDNLQTLCVPCNTRKASYVDRHRPTVATGGGLSNDIPLNDASNGRRGGLGAVSNRDRPGRGASSHAGADLLPAEERPVPSPDRAHQSDRAGAAPLRDSQSV